MPGPSPTHELETRIARLFGDRVDWRRETGVVHVTAIGARPRAAIAVGPSAPRSRTDRFVLGFARARADAIVTTGAILRAEPALVHRTSEDPSEEATWRRWRVDRLGRRSGPLLLVLTASGEIPLDHPALHASPDTIVWTTRAGQSRLGAVRARLEIVVAGDPPEAGERSGSMLGHRDPFSAMAEAIAGLRARAGVETIVLEAGPRSIQPLYGAGAVLDELLLSVFMGGSFPAVAGPELPPTESLARYFAPEGSLPDADPSAAPRGAEPRSRVRIEEASGAWIFERYRRR